jgi:uncharacterized surface protein with fasciclin (FAS1) repeats
MKLPIRFFSAAVTMLVTASSIFASDLSITEFESDELGWQVVDDGVMGGRSKGDLSLTKSGILRFTGKLSLENNGGFSSVRTEDLELDLSDFFGLKMRVKGDGRTYQARLGSDARFRGMEVSFMAEFVTKKDEWIEVLVPFSNFEGSFRGMSLKDEELNPAKVQRLGLLLADKRAGGFALEVDWIHAVSRQAGTIVDEALADGRFKILAAALSEAELIGIFQGDGPFTVFAPTDAAFAKLPEGMVETLLKSENVDQLKAILSYHVVAGKVSAGDALNAKSAATINGQTVEFAIKDGMFNVGGATILETDIACDNGVIHVIDQVLIPSKGEKKAMKKVDPVALIEDAIERGVPTFNHGDPAGCAEIYRECLEVLGADDAIDAELRGVLRKVLAGAEGVGVAERAWLFRRGLDVAYQTIAH